jgi:putative DNA primase/helicase
MYTFADFKSGKPIPRSWDAADAVEDGWTADDIDGFIIATGGGPLEPRPSEAQKTKDKPQDRSKLPAGSPKLTEEDASDIAILKRQMDRRVIQYADFELPRIVDMACDEAVKSGAELYARGTSLVRPVTVDSTTAGRGVKRAEGATVLVPVEKPALVEILTKVIGWQRWDGRRDDWKPVACPSIVAETMLARQGDWPFPQLNAVGLMARS